MSKNGAKYRPDRALYVAGPRSAIVRAKPKDPRPTKKALATKEEVEPSDQGLAKESENPSSGSNSAKGSETEPLNKDLAKERKDKPLAKEKIRDGPKLSEDFVCWNLLHVGECYEWRQYGACKNGSKRTNKIVCGGRTGFLLTARTERGKPRKPEFWKVYEGKDESHAEAVMVRDEELNSFLAHNRNSYVTIFARRQPCHWSQGKEGNDRDPTSCASAVLEWYLRCLVPFGCRLKILCSDLHRAHWRDKKMFGDKNDEVERTSENAREGLRMILRTERASRRGLYLAAFEQADWEVVRTWMDEATIAWMDDELYKKKRAKHDSCIARFFKDLRNEVANE